MTSPIYPVECVTVCVGYADFLSETVLSNQQYFTRWVIVTEPADRATIELCHRHSLPCIVTEDFRRDGGFNKGRGIQRGLDAISCADWILHLDADVALPREFPRALEMAHLDPECIYGCDRMMVRSRDAWDRIKGSGYRQHGSHCYVLPHEKYPIGVRWASPVHGYVPIGFFQLWHGQSSIRLGHHQKLYPDWHSNAARSDVQFALQWDRRRRVLIPEMLVWHLESEPATNGANWKGRTTKPFGPESRTESVKYQ